MDIAGVRALVDNTHNTDTGVDIDRTVLTKGLAECHQLTSWVEAQRLAIVTALNDRADSCPQNDVAKASRTSLRQGQKVSDRAAAAGARAQLGQALAYGGIQNGPPEPPAAPPPPAQPPQPTHPQTEPPQWGARRLVLNPRRDPT